LAGNIIDMNAEAELAYGWSREDLLGRPVKTIVPLERHKQADLLLTQCKRGERVRNVEGLRRTKSGRVLYVLLTLSLLTDEEDKPVAISTIAKNITEHKQAEAEREELITELDAFAHTVAHDLKAPLGIITGYASILAEEHTTMSDEERAEHLHTIVQTGRKMSGIIEELLLLTSVRKQETKIRPLDMASIVAEAQQRLAYLIEEHKPDITLPKTWPTALGYARWVEEVWVNYLSNAIKYGGQPPYLELGATEQANSMVRFWVYDNGNGLTPEDQVGLFAPFTRLNQVRAKGHGLGLSIVQRIVKKLGGQVGVESKVGQGSLFWFTLPSSAKLEEAEENTNNKADEKRSEL
jgi:PAS domain S-box-containing protein